MKYDVLEPRHGHDGFYDESLPMIIHMHDVDAETANRYMMYHLEYRLYARDLQTNDMYHRTSTGLKKL